MLCRLLTHRTDNSGFPWGGGFPTFSRAKLEVGDPYHRFLDYLEVVLRVRGRLLSEGYGRLRNYLRPVIRSSDHSGPDYRAARPCDR